MDTPSLEKPHNNDKPESEPANRITDPAPDPFDPANLTLGQDFHTSTGVKKVLTTIPCRKPNRQEFVRTRPGVEWRIETAVFESKTDREHFLVDRSLWAELGDEIYPVCLFLTVTRQGDLSLWPIRLPAPDGRTLDWHSSAANAAELAQDQWIRVVANMRAGMYDTFAASAELPEPEWPDQIATITDALRLCFADRFIRDASHSALKALRGEV